MPDLDFDEIEYCVHCGAELTEPPTCCAEADADWLNEIIEVDDKDIIDMAAQAAIIGEDN